MGNPISRIMATGIGASGTRKATFPVLAVTFKGSREDGVGSLFLELVSPPGGGPPPHTDPSEELFYDLDGEFEFTLSGPAGLASVRSSHTLEP